MLNFKNKKFIGLAVLVLLLIPFIYAIVSGDSSHQSGTSDSNSQILGKLSPGSQSAKKSFSISAETEISPASLEIDSADFSIYSGKVWLKGKTELILNDASLNLSGFSGTLIISESDNMVLEGHFSRMHNHGIEISSIEDALIEVHGGNISSDHLSIPHLKTSAKGRIVIDDKFRMDLDSDHFELDNFEGRFSVSSYPPTISLSGPVRSLYLNNNEYSFNLG